MTDDEKAAEEERARLEEEMARTKAAWDALGTAMATTVPVYRYDPEKKDEVHKMLADDGWDLNADGEPFVFGEDEVRCKMIDGQLVKLDLTMAYPEGNPISDFFSDSLLDKLAEQGIKVTMVPVEMNELRAMLHRDTERSCDMIYIATNFDEVFDPSPMFDTSDADTGNTNYSGINDPILFELAKDMSRTEPGDNYTYATKWVKFQARYQEVVPSIPVYGNVYVDFYTSCLHDYDITQNVTWTEAIIYAYMSDPMMEEPELEENDEFDDGGMIFLDD